MLLRSLLLTSLFMTLAFILAACGTYGSPEYKKMLAQYIKTDFLDQDSDASYPVYELTLDDAINLGLERNVGLRVTALETLAAGNRLTLQKLQAFPSIQLKASTTGRSNDGASSSRSVITGSQSLEPSISSERYKRTVELETSLDILDITLAVLRSRTASNQEQIAALQQQKVQQDLVRDITVAYYRALAAQNNIKNLSAARNRANHQIDNISSAMNENIFSGEDGGVAQEQLIERIQEINTRITGLGLANLELKTLLDIPPRSQLYLKDKGRIAEFSNELRVSQSITALETFALKNRPELSEQFLNRNISLRNKRLSVIETFPGASLLFTFHRDSNKFLADNTWNSATASLVQSITKLITLPSRFRSAETSAIIEDEKMQSILAGVLAQVNVAKRRLDLEKQSYEAVRRAHSIVSRKAKIAKIQAQDGLKPQQENIIAQMDYTLVKADKDLAYVELQSAYAELLNSLGVESRRTPVEVKL